MNTKLFKIGSYFFSITSAIFLIASAIFDKTWINIFSIVFLFLDLICVCLQNRGQKKQSDENVDTKRTVIAVVILGVMLVLTAVMLALSIFNAGHHV